MSGRSDVVPPPTERIQFREYTMGDTAMVEEMFSDAQARQFYPEMADASDSRRWIEWNLKNYATHGFGLWALESRETGVFLGDCGLSFQPVEGQEVLEVGYHLAAAHRGRGYATEAARACVEYALCDLGEVFVCSLTHPDNSASIAVASAVHDHRRSYLKPDGTERLMFWTGEIPGAFAAQPI